MMPRACSDVGCEVSWKIDLRAVGILLEAQSSCKCSRLYPCSSDPFLSCSGHSASHLHHTAHGCCHHRRSAHTAALYLMPRILFRTHLVHHKARGIRAASRLCVARARLRHPARHKGGWRGALSSARTWHKRWRTPRWHACYCNKALPTARAHHGGRCTMT